MASGASWFYMALSSAICWGLAYTITEKSMRMGMNPVFLLGVFNLFQAGIFLTIAKFNGTLRGQIQTLSENTNLLAWALVGLFAYAAGNLLIFMAIQEKNAAMANLIEISYPVFTILFSLALFRTTEVNIWALTGGALILSGIALIYLKG